MFRYFLYCHKNTSTQKYVMVYISDPKFRMLGRIHNHISPRAPD